MTNAAAPIDTAAESGPLLHADKVTMRFGGLIANRDVDFTIPRGSIVSLIGPNGAGKTTFFNQLTGMLTPTSGDIVFDGDSLVGRSPHEIVELARVLRAAPRGRLGTVASLGNHDYGRNWKSIAVADDVSRVATDAGMVVLRNDVRTLAGLQFAGLADFWSPEFGPHHGLPPTGELIAPVPSRFARADTDASDALRLLARDAPTVVLSHNPDVQDLPIWDGVRGWVLGGHTHGGQVKPPFLPPPILPVQNKRYTAGAFDVGPGRTLYVNRGLGFLNQVRFDVRPELTLFTLTRAPAAVG